MSHDQKPSKVRLVSTGAVSGATPGAASRGPANDTAPAPAAAKAGHSPILLALLFVLGATLGGAVLPLLHIL